MEKTIFDDYFHFPAKFLWNMTVSKFLKSVKLLVEETIFACTAEQEIYNL